jgi:hypothetical protein
LDPSKFANIKIKLTTLELNDFTNEDVLKVSNLDLMLSMSHQTPSQMVDTGIQEISNVVECLK